MATEQPAEKPSIPLANLGVVTICSMLQLVLQFLFVVWLAKRFGTSPEMDAFNAAFAIPLSLTGILVGPIPMVLIPELVRLDREGSDGLRWRLAASISLLTIGLMLGLAVLAYVFAAPICDFLYAGFDSQQSALATQSLRWLGWLLPLNAGVTLLQATHHSRQRFRLAAISNVVGVGLSFAWIAAIPRLDLAAVCASLLAGAAAANLVLVVPLARDLGRGCVVGLRGLGLRRFSTLLMPLFIASAWVRLEPIVDRSIASFLEAGSIAELGYAQRLVTAFMTLATSGLSVVIFPKLASISARVTTPAFANLLATGLRFLVLLLTPCVVAILFFAGPMVSDLFERGAFDAEATAAVAKLLLILTGFLIAGSVGEIASKALYAMSDTRLPAIIAISGFTIGVILKWYLSRSLGIDGVAWATTIYFSLCMVASLLALRWRLGGAMFAGTLGAMRDALIASSAAILVGYLAVTSLGTGGAIVGGLLGLAAYTGVLVALRNEFVMRRSGGESSPG